MKERIVLRSEFLPPLVLRDTITPGSSVGIDIVGNIVKPAIDIELEQDGFSYQQTYAPYGEPQAGRILLIAVIIVAIIIVWRF